MKYTWTLLFLLFFAPSRAKCSRIAIGYFYSDKVSIWRFWERGKDGQPEAKMLVYNVTDSAIKFSLKKCFHRVMRTKPVPRRGPADSTYVSQRGSDANLGSSYEVVYSDTIVNEAKIPPHSYQVYRLVPSNSVIIYDAVFVNGEFAGICQDLEEIQVPAKHKYYSAEGLQGTPSRSYVIAKDKLVGKGKRDEIHLYSKKTNTLEANRTVMTDNVTGVKAFSICFGNGTCHKRDGKSSSMNFSVDVGGASGAAIVLSCVVADKKKQTMFEIGEKVGDQSDGNSLLPVFVK